MLGRKRNGPGIGTEPVIPGLPGGLVCGSRIDLANNELPRVYTTPDRYVPHHATPHRPPGCRRDPGMLPSKVLPETTALDSRGPAFRPCGNQESDSVS